jgi:hypothetical protein
VKAYYDRRAPEYDEWYLGLGRFDGLERLHWDDDLRALERTVAALPPARTLDVGCGIVDSAVRPDCEPEERQDRVLNDGSRWTVYKRYFTRDELARELGDAEVLHESNWFVVVRSIE